MLSLTQLSPFTFLTSLELLAGGFLLYYAAWIIYSRFFHPYHDIPGPFLASITQWWYFRALRYGEGERSQLPIHQNYGKFVRIAPDEVSICDAAAIDTVYGPSPVFPKTEFYDAFKQRMFAGRVDAFTERDEKVHAVYRKKIGYLFAPGAVLEYEPCIDRIIELFCKRMESFANSGQIVDVATYFRKYTFDVIGEIFHGRDGGFGFLRDDVDYNGWMGMLNLMTLPISSLGYVPKGMQTLFLMYNMAFSKDFRNGFKQSITVQEQSQAIVKERQEAIKAGKESIRNDYVSKMMNIVQDRGEKIDFNMDDVAVNVWVMIWAGSDTTGFTICSLFYYVMKNPEVLKKLQDEIDDAFETGKLSFPNVRFSDAMKLPYLTACVKETMRISPALGTGLPRFVPKGGVTIAGRFFPEGYKVIMNQNAVHFDKECFGEDAGEFVPERYLQADKRKVDYMERHNMGFGLGPRVCLGKHVK